MDVAVLTTHSLKGPQLAFPTWGFCVTPYQVYNITLITAILKASVSCNQAAPKWTPVSEKGGLNLPQSSSEFAA